MSPKKYKKIKVRQVKEQYVPEIEDDFEIDDFENSGELIAYISKLKKIIDLERNENKDALREFERRKRLHQAMLKDLDNLNAQSAKMDEEINLLGYKLDRNLREREEKILHAKHEGTEKLMNVRKNFMEYLKEAEPERNKAKFMDMEDLDDTKLGAFELHSEYINAMHFQRIPFMKLLGKNDIETKYDGFNERRCNLLCGKLDGKDMCRGRTIGQSQAEQGNLVPKYEAMRKELWLEGVKRLVDRKKFLRDLVMENEKVLKHYKVELEHIPPARPQVRIVKAEPTPPIPPRERFCKALNMDNQFDCVRKNIDYIQSMILVLEHLEDLIAEKIEYLINKESKGIECETLKKQLAVCQQDVAKPKDIGREVHEKSSTQKLLSMDLTDRQIDVEKLVKTTMKKRRDSLKVTY